jgi:hypothetical protein
MAKYSANEFLWARPIAQAILADASFRQWFLSKTRFANLALLAQPQVLQQASLRTTPNARKWFWFNYFCARKNCECRIETGIESDILIILKATNGLSFAVHIEVKCPGDGLDPGQAESYSRRGRCWANSTTRPHFVLEHEDFLTMIVCDDNLASDRRIKEFDAPPILHRHVADRINPYPDLVDFRYA